MRELTARELDRQDYVDNQIYRLLVALAPENTSISWNIEMIGAIRDTLKTWIVDKLALCEEGAFYPYVSE
jgi:hypothetical protein